MGPRHPVVVIILICAAVLAYAPALLADTIGWITGVVGTPIVQRPGMGEVRASVGIGVQMGDMLITGPDGRLKVLFVDDSILCLGSDTKVEVTDFLFDQGRKARNALFDLIKGKVKLLVGKLFAVETNVKVRTPTAVAGVSGTTFVVEYSEQRKLTSLLTVYGAVGVSSSNPSLQGVFMVTAGEITSIQFGELPTEPRKASDAQIADYLEQTHVPDSVDLSSVPGHANNIVDNPVKGTEYKYGNSTFARNYGEATEGEGGAEFEAYQASEENLSDTDLPLPGDLYREVAGFNHGEESPSSMVKVTVQFHDNSDEKEKKKE